MKQNGNKRTVISSSVLRYIEGKQSNKGDIKGGVIDGYVDDHVPMNDSHIHNGRHNDLENISYFVIYYIHFIS